MLASVPGAGGVGVSECSPQRLCQEGAGHSGELPGAAQQLGVWRERDGRCACCPRKNPAPPSCSASPEAQRWGLCSGPVGTEIRGPLRLTQMEDRCEDSTGQPADTQQGVTISVTGRTCRNCQPSLSLRDLSFCFCHSSCHGPAWRPRLYKAPLCAL